MRRLLLALVFLVPILFGAKVFATTQGNQNVDVSVNIQKNWDVLIQGQLYSIPFNVSVKSCPYIFVNGEKYYLPVTILVEKNIWFGVKKPFRDLDVLEVNLCKNGDGNDTVYKGAINFKPPVQLDTMDVYPLKITLSVEPKGGVNDDNQSNNVETYAVNAVYWDCYVKISSVVKDTATVAITCNNPKGLLAGKIVPYTIRLEEFDLNSGSFTEINVIHGQLTLDGNQWINKKVKISIPDKKTLYKLYAEVAANDSEGWNNKTLTVFDKRPPQVDFFVKPVNTPSEAIVGKLYTADFDIGCKQKDSNDPHEYYVAYIFKVSEGNKTIERNKFYLHLRNCQEVPEITVGFTPEREGNYNLEVQILNSDSNPKNNRYTWTVTALEANEVNQVEDNTPPTIEEFNVYPTEVNVLKPVFVTWEVNDESNVSVTVDCGNGVVKENLPAEGNVTCVYVYPGTYTVKLIATDEWNNVSEANATVTVVKPTPDYYVSPVNVPTEWNVGEEYNALLIVGCKEPSLSDYMEHYLGYRVTVVAPDGSTVYDETFTQILYCNQTAPVFVSFTPETNGIYTITVKIETSDANPSDNIYTWEVNVVGTELNEGNEGSGSGSGGSGSGGSGGAGGSEGNAPSTPPSYGIGTVGEGNQGGGGVSPTIGAGTPTPTYTETPTYTIGVLGPSEPVYLGATHEEGFVGKVGETKPATGFATLGISNWIIGGIVFLVALVVFLALALKPLPFYISSEIFFP